MSISLELITSQGKLLEEEITELFAVTASGEIGILNNHTDLTSKLLATPIRYTRTDGSKDVVAVLGGILELENNKITIVSNFAQKADDIDELEAEAAAKKAEADVKMHDSKQRGDRDLILAEYDLQKELLKLKSARLKKQFN